MVRVNFIESLLKDVHKYNKYHKYHKLCGQLDGIKIETNALILWSYYHGL